MAIKTGLIQGPLLATLSAVLFGISPVLCKMVIGEMSPVLLAGLLCLGSGIGLSFVLVRQRINIIREIHIPTQFDQAEAIHLLVPSQPPHSVIRAVERNI